jgi:hypothetical protein
METTEYRSDFFDRIEAIGEARGEAKALIIVLESRGMHLTSEQHDLVASCTDADKLELWLDRAATAASIDDVFKD